MQTLKEKQELERQLDLVLQKKTELDRRIELLSAESDLTSKNGFSNGTDS